MEELQTQEQENTISNNNPLDGDDGQHNGSIQLIKNMHPSLLSSLALPLDQGHFCKSSSKEKEAEMLLLKTDSTGDYCEDDKNNILNYKGQLLTKAERRTLREEKRQQKIKEAEEELERRALKRSMSSNQELWNAVTMLPAWLYGVYVCLSGEWLTQNDIDQVSLIQHEWRSTFDSSSCIQSSMFPNLYAAPPLTVVAHTLGFFLHSPISIYYHILCAYKLPPGPKRMDHWARRLDQAMIHYISFMVAYSTSANTDYLLVTMAFNIDCMYRLFQKGMRPKRTLYRMICAFLIPVLPFIVRKEFLKVLLLVTIYSISGWLFASYPIGGWSHGAFHLVAWLSNPILIRSSLSLDVEIVRESIDTAAKCAVFLKGS